MHKRKNLIIGVLLAAVFLAWGMTPPTAQTAPFPVVGPNGYYTPDYFGTTPNWAYSPLLTKFVDPLPGLWDPKNPVPATQPVKSIPLAVPDKQTYPGSDYYEISLEEFTEVMHSEMTLGTKLRGYRQTNSGKDQDGSNVVAPAAIRYLGPVIVATKDRPVRIKFTNNLPAGAPGKLFVPVDLTIMGAGPGPTATRNQEDHLICNSAPAAITPAACFTENRANLHLHGGRTPWISDGTPHQWIIPAADTNSKKKGASVVNVPDMWFLPNGTHVTACAGMTTCPSQPTATNDPGNGSQTYYYTNQQSARMLFYHDHAWGITRLNVYVGMAAGYIISDALEAALTFGGTVSGRTYGAGTIPSDVIPLIIQDKTFVNATTVMTTDPTWAWGRNPAKPVTTTPVTGDLWWPHVYMPAQNPYAGPAGNAFNPMGRWVYGPWFWPPTTNIAYPPKANPYSDQAGQPPVIPGTPNPSWGAEAFMDTPVVNGAAYPTLTVQPQKYRFRILNAAHDRFFNLQLYRAVNQNGPNTAADIGAASFAGPITQLTEVRMVPAAPGAFGGGADVAMWPQDGREGGAPDPTTRGPAMIQIMNEGGFLPKPVVLPNQPINWNVDPTMFQAGLVLPQRDGGGTLQLGPAERADVIIDFSDFAGHTLILYNDAPAPWPALDPHYDYYTGAPDRRAEMGGANTTVAGFGPNTRTLMQIVVGDGVGHSGLATADDYDPDTLLALENAFKSTGTPGVFAASQDPIVAGQGDFWRGTADAGTYNAYDTAYNKVFSINPADWGISTIYDTSLKVQDVIAGGTKTIKMKPKAIQDEMGEVFDEYGRMSAKLGLELPFTTALNQTFVVQNYVDPATEIVYPNDIQIWKITHNGVDTHPVHFHLFDVQVLNRVGWDGFVTIPDDNELGWKETVRISPLQDTIVALRPIVPQVPFAVPNSVRPLNPAMPLNSTMGFTNIDPLTATPINPPVTNVMTSFGHEYVWHCHILSHEESDMMRPMILNRDQLLYVANASNGIWQWELGKWTQINAAVPTQIVADGPRMYASITGNGLWQWDGSAWTKLGTLNPIDMVASGSSLYASYTGQGLHKWDGSAWTKLGTLNPIDMVASGSILYASYTGQGLHKWDGSAWTKLGTLNPIDMVASGSSLYASYTGQGLHKWDGSAWTKLGTLNPIDMVASGSILYASYTGQGLHKWDGSAWTKLGTLNPVKMAASGSILYASYTGQGLHKWDGSAWTKLGTLNPTDIVASGVVLYADYGATGLYKWEGGTWTRLSTTDPSIIVAGL
jgi:FtsP/CotA-like multicopper oxidase with cupredoxin domain